MFDIRHVKDFETVQRLVRATDSSHTEMMQRIIADSGVILDHHFSHSGDSSVVSQHSQHLIRFRVLGREKFICGELAETLLACSGMNLDGHKILSPERAGFFLGHSLSQIIRPNNHTGHIVSKVDAMHNVVCNFNEPLRSGKIMPGDEVVVVNDVDHTGSSLERLINMVRHFHGNVSKVLVFATWNYEDFQRRMNALGVTGYALVEFRAEHWLKNDCPVCRLGNCDLEPASEWS